MSMERSSSSSFPIFIDTSLDTHLSLLANRDDTVAQLKGRMMNEHPLCFPQIGEISIQAVKVKVGEIYYHLPDSMTMRFAFQHIVGVRSLHIDLLPALCTINNQTQTKLMDDSDVQPQIYNSLSVNHNASFLPTSEVYHHECIPGDSETKKGLIPVLVSREHESTTLPGACEQTPSELETAQIEEHAISDAVQQSFDNDTDLNNKKERVVLEHRNAEVETKKDALLVSNKNEKHLKHNGSLQGDELLSEKDHEEKRGHKKDKVVNSDSIQEAAVLFDSSIQDPTNPLVSSKDEIYQKQTSSMNCDEILSEKDHVEKRKRKKNEDVNSDNFQEASVQLDASLQDPSDVKLKRKKKKVSSSNDELPQNNPVDESLPMVDDAAKENQTKEKFVEVMVSNSKDMGKESEIVVVPKEANSLHISIPQVQSLGQALVDAKRKRREKVLEEPPQNKPINNSLDEGDACDQEKPIKENHVQEITDKNVKLEKISEIAVTHGHDSSGFNATSKEIQAQEFQVQENHVEELNKQNHNKTAAADSSVDESKITSIDKKKRRTHKKKEKTEPLVEELQSSMHEIVNSSTDQVTLNFTEAPSVINHLENSSAGLNAKGAVEDISKAKKPKRSRKKSGKTEQQESNMQPDTQKIVNSTVDQGKENSTKELSDNPTKVMEEIIIEAAACEKKPKRSRKKTANIEPEHQTAASDHPIMDTTVQAKPSDQMSKRSKKKFKEADFPSKKTSMIKESTTEKLRESSTDKIGHNNENSEEVSRTVDEIIDELDGVNNQIDAHHTNIPKYNEPDHILQKPTRADFVSKNEETAKENQEEMIKDRTVNTDENLKSLSSHGDKKTTNANSKEVPQADTEKIDFMEYFGRIAKQHEIVEEKASKKMKRKKKLNASPHDSTTVTVKTLKHEQTIAEKRLQESNSSGQSLNNAALQVSKAQVDATRKQEIKDANDVMASKNNSGVATDMVRLAALDDSNEKDTPSPKITSRCAIKKVKYNSVKGKVSNYDGKKAAPNTIFDNDGTDSGSSVDDFIISSRRVLGKTSSANSSETDDDSDGSDETNISRGAADDKGINNAFGSPTKSSKKRGPISTILKSTRSYRKAKLTDSQYEFDDIGSQIVDMVPETQPESPEI